MAPMGHNGVCEYAMEIGRIRSLCVFVGGDLVADRHVKAAFDSPTCRISQIYG